MSIRNLLAEVLLLLAFCSCTEQQEQKRVVQDFNAVWTFSQEGDSSAINTDFNDMFWRILDLPHDWSIEGAFSPDNPTEASGGYLPAGIGWYRKTFFLPEDAQDKLHFIEFDGVYRNSEVWINGQSLGKRPNGYISFSYELTPYLNYGKEHNVIVVRVDNSLQPSSRWYTGSGIYRNVRLVSVSKMHIPQWGTYITTPEISEENALVRIETSISNRENSEGTVKVSIYKNGELLISSEENPFVSDTVVSHEISVHNPKLWSCDQPELYEAVTQVYRDGQLVDEQTTRFGIREFHFDPYKGFFLNGESLKILGVNNHHDLGALGAAVNIRAIERQLEILKAMGCNAIRTAHNPPAPELLDLCDEMGFLVMDEAFDAWKKKKAKKDYHLFWDEWHEQDLKDFIRRDRNHPSIIMWSIGNEIREQFDSTGTTITRELVDIVKSLDTTRPVTCALTENIPKKNYIYQSGALDILGFNYKQEAYKTFHDTYPGETMIASENMSALATRGHYDMPSDEDRIWPPGYKMEFDSNADYTVSAYDHVYAYWGSTHEQTWHIVKNYDHIPGLFVWSGFDFIGEPVPYFGWPSRSSYYGIIDLAGFPKDAYYMYQSEWTEDTMLHVFPHWNWQEGHEVDVWAYYNNADEAELFLNDVSQGVRSKNDSTYHVMWRLNFEPGTIKVVTRKNGDTVAEKQINTAGEPAQIVLTPDRQTITANGRDLSFITAEILDKDGNLVATANNHIEFMIDGPGFIVGVDNGYQANTEPFKGNTINAYNGKCLLIVRSTEEKGTISILPKSDDLTSEGVIIKTK